MAASKLGKYIGLSKWYIKGKPIPTPHFVKQRMIRKYKKNRGILIETGTYKGDMVQAMKNTFDKIYSIEVDKKLFEEARNRFLGDASIHLFNGDSGHILKELLPSINRSAVYWLDGHYSGGITSKGDLNTPIFKELDAIFDHDIKTHQIIIDDARCFIGKDDYPTIQELDRYISEKTESHKIKIINDMIVVSYN